ncbi:NAD-dependent succinate-semialdehyde dehydrogenase [Corynebacterium lactis]|uniref:Succinate-semialdehyde dehdyrogenase n=1 Tax=Corynebacterium lactis RW2-5 TaxID=1408189 RepID=A0A0K2GZB5_9CORY|nr:NAD-dependent succinate-semialdehyde dehydrogenase [Corynebacterium lactis]ALA66796.1 succinate-semialdehyde dehdyrogenase [Corynebacterium lactis RW2-5]
MANNRQAPKNSSNASRDDESRYATILEGVPTDLLLRGEFRAASGGETFSVINPATDKPLVEVASASEADARQALEDACAAQEAWAATAPRERGEILRRVFELIHRDEEKLAHLQSLEMGRALADSKAEVGYSAEFFRWFSEEAVRITGDYRISPNGASRVVVVRQPVGPVLAITPWNFPLAMGARKIAPALAAGCPIIVKPASKTPLTMLYLGKLLVEAGVPAGVVSVLPTAHSSEVSKLLDDDRLRKFTFTGSTEVGQMLAAKAAETSMKVSLELGGNAPFVVLSDGDVDKAVKAVKAAKLRNGGQVCIAPNRFIIHEDKAQDFVDGVVKLFAELKLGEGTDAATTLGPLALRSQQETVRDLVKDATERGAKVVFGGAIPDLGGELSDGYFFEPTVLTDVPYDADIVRDEIFGPVVAVTTFSDDSEALERANDTIFGLAAYVFSENLTKALGAAEKIESGMVAVNKGSLSDPSAPFGGVKQSGLGREGGFTGIDEFLEEKLISLEN